MSKSNNIVKWDTGNNIVDSGISITSIGSGGVSKTDLLSSGSPTNSSQTYIVSNLSTNYKHLIIDIIGVNSIGPGSQLKLFLSSDNGSTYSSEYIISNNTTELLTSFVNIYNTGFTNTNKYIRFSTFQGSTPVLKNVDGFTESTKTGLINCIQLYFFNSFTSAGTIKIYGVS